MLSECVVVVFLDKMSITTCQKVTLISCSVLCVSLFLPRMLLPRAKEDVVQAEVGPGFYPSMMHRLPLPRDSDQWGTDPLHTITHNAETLAKVKGMGRKKYNLMAQVIPIYGFGILLYIFYIIYKLTCKRKSTKSGNFTTTYKAPTDHTGYQLNEYELARLQLRLLQTEQMMQMIVSGKSRGAGSGQSRRSKRAQSKREEKLRRQLRQLTELIQEGRLEGASPEMEAEEVPYYAGWDGYPEETYPEYDDDDEPCNRKRYKPVTVVDTPSQPTAEALAERMEQEEEEVSLRKLEVVHEEDEEEGEEEEGEEEEEEVEEESDKDMTQDEQEEDEEELEEEEEEEESKWLLGPPSPMLASEKKKEFLGLEVSTKLRSHSPGKKITFSEHRDVYRYPREDTFEEAEGQMEEKKEEEEEEEEESETEEEVTEMGEELEADEDDPVMEAESLQFSCEVGTSPEREAEEETGDDLLGSEEGHVPVEQYEHGTVSGLRMRNRRDT